MWAKTEKKIVELDTLEAGAVVTYLNDKRTELQKEQRCTDIVDDLILKVIDAPTKKEYKGRRKDEGR